MDHAESEPPSTIAIVGLCAFLLAAAAGGFVFLRRDEISAEALRPSSMLTSLQLGTSITDGRLGGVAEGLVPVMDRPRQLIILANYQNGRVGDVVSLELESRGRTLSTCEATSNSDGPGYLSCSLNGVGPGDYAITVAINGTNVGSRQFQVIDSAAMRAEEEERELSRMAAEEERARSMLSDFWLRRGDGGRALFHTCNVFNGESSILLQFSYEQARVGTDVISGVLICRTISLNGAIAKKLQFIVNPTFVCPFGMDDLDCRLATLNHRDVTGC